jgi:hypothetical protein
LFSFTNILTGLNASHRPEALLHDLYGAFGHVEELLLLRAESRGDEQLRFGLGRDPLHVALAGVRVMPRSLWSALRQSVSANPRNNGLRHPWLGLNLAKVNNSAK